MAADAPAASSSSNGISGERPPLQTRCFSHATPEATLHFQIVDLGRQVYVWIGVGEPKLPNLYFAIQARVRACVAGGGGGGRFVFCGALRARLHP